MKPLLYMVIITGPMLSNPLVLVFDHWPDLDEAHAALTEFRVVPQLALLLREVLRKFMPEQIARLEERARKGSLDVSMSLNVSAIPGLQFTMQVVQQPG